MASIVLASLVVVGVATGTHRQFDKGVTSTRAVDLVIVFGLACIAALVVVMFQAARLWRRGRAMSGTWLLSAIVLWVTWAFFRVGEYAS